MSTINIGDSATAATPAQLAAILAALGSPRSGFGSCEALARYLYTGETTDFALNADGTETASATWTTPADAVAAEYWVNSLTSTDEMYIATTTGVISASGSDLATRAAYNTINVMKVVGGEKIVIPFETVGVRPLLRFGTNVSGLRCQGRYISAASPNLKYKQAVSVPLTASVMDKLVGNSSGIQQFNYGTTNKFPAGYTAVMFRVVGPGPVRCSLGSPQNPTATVGDFLAPGLYFIDVAAHGIALTAIRFYIPTGTNIVAYALFNR